MTWTVYNIYVREGGVVCFCLFCFSKNLILILSFPEIPEETQLCDFRESIDFIFGKEVKMTHIYQCIIHTVKNIKI